MIERRSLKKVRNRSTVSGLFCGLFATVLFARPASGDEPYKVTEPTVLREPAEITQVVDAFDADDPFDLHLSLGFVRTWKTANIRRDTAISQPGLTTGGYVSDRLNIAEYSETTSRLLPRADIGIYKDLALIVRVPIILSNERELSDLDGSASQQRTVLEGAPGEQLFRLPFKSPTRSGIEYLALGLDVGIMSQARDLTKPTWVFGFEGRFNVSEPMHACNPDGMPLNLAGGSQVECAFPSDVNRNGVSDGASEGTFSGSRDAGISRGTTGLEVHTYLSKRVKYIEPYGGFNALFEFQNESSDYGIVDLRGSLVNHPPLVGSMVVGLAVIPWEIRDRYQRVTFDFRLTGTYTSEGRDYSELFDALGSSDAPTLREPKFAEFMANPAGDPPSVIDPDSQKVYFTGLTDVQQHASVKLSTQFTWQAGEYIKFNLGGAVSLEQSHYLTFDQACNPDFDNDLGEAGPCRQGTTPTGIPNPNFRRVINEPTRRFLVDDVRAFDAWINAVVMF
jgi:hypothetical protein